MAFKVNKTENKEKVYFELSEYGAQVTNVRVLSETQASFTLRCRGFSLYNLRVVCMADGREFVAVPSTKAKNGNYYDQYALYLSDEDQKTVIAKVKELVCSED